MKKIKCKNCINYDKETGFCNILIKNRFKDPEIYRICKDYVKKAKKNENISNK